MDELIKLISEKTGLSADMAKVAVDTVVSFLKQKLPAPVAGQIDALLGGTGEVSGLGNIAQGLGGFLGKK